jgi:polyisoprenoid-binding protein YceI
MITNGKSFALLGAFLLSTGLANAATAPAASAWKVDFDHDTGLTEFHAVGRPSALKINGKGDAPKGEIELVNGKAKGVLTVDMTSLDTGISMRTHHMKEKYLETEKFPKAKLTISEVTLPESAAKGDFAVEKAPFKGTLLLHGVEKPVTGTANVARKGDSVDLLSNFALKVSDYGISIPSFAGITMADDVTLDVQAKAPVVSVKK